MIHFQSLPISKETERLHYFQECWRRSMGEGYVLVWEYKKTHPCVDCGEPDPIVLDFDHRDPKKKKFTIGNLTGFRVTIKELQDEIAKCDIRCSNCHRRKTSERRNPVWKPVETDPVKACAAADAAILENIK